jgi:hypothetical protein
LAITSVDPATRRSALSLMIAEMPSIGRCFRSMRKRKSAASRSAAFEIAEVLSAQRLTVWVFAAEPRAGKLRYRLLGVLPDSGT